MKLTMPTSPPKRGATPYGSESKLNHQRTAGFSLCLHLPGSHLGYLFDPHPCGLDSTEVIRRIPRVPGIGPSGLGL